MRIACFCVVFACFLLCLPCLADPRYDIIGLDMSQASGVFSADGQVQVVGSRLAEPPFEEYYESVWQTVGENSVVIGSGSGIFSSHASAIYGTSAVGYIYRTNGDGEPFIRANLYESGIMRELDMVSNESRAEDINSFGYVVGSANFGNRPAETPCMWRVENGTTNMTRIGNVERGSALAINNFNRVVGYIDVNGHNRAAYLADFAGTMELLNVPGETSIAEDINDRGDILGMFINNDGNMRTFVTHSDASNTISLLDIPGRGSSMFAGAINSDGWVVGQFLSEDVSFHAYLWSPDTGTLDLNSLIDPASGWQLRSATGISDGGHIVGYGINPTGEFQAFLLQPVPCPESLFVFALGGFLSVSKRNRKN